jgi:outer membrane protein assembly factor BamB
MNRQLACRTGWWLTLLVLAGGVARVDAEDWGRFRGPTGQGLSAERELPTEWTTERHVVWKTPIEGAGWSSPIVWGERVYVTSAVGDGSACHLIALERDTGRVVWNRQVATQELKRKEGKNSFATPTPCIDGERIYACFADGTMVAVNLAGETVWTNKEFPFYSKHGLGESPIVHQDLVIMPFDGSSPGPDIEVGWKKPWDRAMVVAFDAATGKVRWKTGRGLSRVSHMTPLMLEVDGRTQLLSPAGDRVQGFDPLTGELLWSAYSQGEGVTPSPAAGDGLLFTSSGFEKPTIRAVRLGDAKGDVTASHIVWEQQKGTPTQASLIYVAPYLYAVTDNGVLSCYQGTTGELVWQDRLGGKFSASPVYAAGRLYFLSEEGTTFVVATGAEFRLLAQNPLGEVCQATPAIAAGKLFIRTASQVYAIGE